MNLILISLPALIGLLALVGAIRLIPASTDDQQNVALRWAGVIALFVVAFGIGTCYALAFTSL